MPSLLQAEAQGARPSRERSGHRDLLPPAARSGAAPLRVAGALALHAQPCTLSRTRIAFLNHQRTPGTGDMHWIGGLRKLAIHDRRPLAGPLPP